MCANLDDAEFANIMKQKPIETKQEQKPVNEDSYALDLDFLDRPITVQGIDFPSYRKFIDSCEEYPEDNVYDPDFIYEEEDDKNDEVTYMAETNWRESVIQKHPQ